MIRKIVLGIIIISSFISCGKSGISTEKIKSDLIGTNIQDAWNFDMPSEILDIRIISEKKTNDIKEINTEFLLEDYKKHTVHYLRASLIYKYENNEWKYIKGNKLDYRKTIKRNFSDNKVIISNENVIGTDKFANYINGQTNTTNKQFFDGSSIKIRFDQSYLSIKIYNSIFSEISSISEDDSWSKMKVLLFDLDKDKKDEFIVCLFDKYNTSNKCLIFKKNYSDEKSECKLIKEFEIQSEVVLTDNKIEIPIGSQGLSLIYELKSNKFIQKQ